MSTVFDCMFSVLGKIMGQVLQTILGVVLVDFGFCRGIGKTVLKRFRSDRIQQVSKCVAGSQIYHYDTHVWSEGKKESCGNGVELGLSV